MLLFRLNIYAEYTGIINKKTAGNLTMIDAKIIDDLVTKLSQIIPPEVQKMGAETHAQMKLVVQSALSKMDLVTREEFEVQTKVLQKTRAKLTELEARVERLEKGPEA